MTGVIETSRQGELLVRSPQEVIRNRPTGRPPTVKRCHRVHIRQLSPKLDPAFLHERRSVQLADILPRARAVPSPDRLRGELILGHSELPRQQEAEGVAVRNCVCGQVARKVSQNLERCTCAAAKSWACPAEDRFRPCWRKCVIGHAQNQVDGGETVKYLALIAQDVRWDDSDPEWVKGNGRVAV